MKTFVFVCTLMLNTILSFPLYSQVDSSAVYPVHKWRLDRMIMEVEKGRACGELVKFQENEIQKGLGVEIMLNNELHTAKERTTAVQHEQDITREERDQWKGRFENQKDMTRHEKKQKGKWKLATVVSVGFVVLQFVFGK